VFQYGNVGYGSAMAVLLTAIVVGVGIVYARLQARRQVVPARAEAEP
jgi:raffinose/stachyose/melibiose transport system permease protein